MHCRVTRLRLFSRCWKKKIEDKSNDDAFEDEGEEVVEVEEDEFILEGRRRAKITFNSCNMAIICQQLAQIRTGMSLDPLNH